MWRGQNRFSHLTSTAAGISILMKPKSSIIVVDFSFFQGRAISCKLSLNSCVFVMFFSIMLLHVREIVFF